MDDPSDQKTRYGQIDKHQMLIFSRPLRRSASTLSHFQMQSGPASTSRNVITPPRLGLGSSRCDIIRLGAISENNGALQNSIAANGVRAAAPIGCVNVPKVIKVYSVQFISGLGRGPLVQLILAKPGPKSNS